MKNDCWIDNSYVDTFGTQKTVSSLLIAIPPEHQGALETLMLEAISEDPYDAAIVKSAGDFVDAMQKSASRYISNNRMKLKAHLGVTWAVQYPEKVFKLFDEQIRSVSWEKSEVLHSCFRQLERIWLRRTKRAGREENNSTLCQNMREITVIQHFVRDDWKDSRSKYRKIQKAPTESTGNHEIKFAQASTESAGFFCWSNHRQPNYLQQKHPCMIHVLCRMMLKKFL